MDTELLRFGSQTDRSRSTWARGWKNGLIAELQFKKGIALYAGAGENEELHDEIMHEWSDSIRRLTINLLHQLVTADLRRLRRALYTNAAQETRHAKRTAYSTNPVHIPQPIGDHSNTFGRQTAFATLTTSVQ